MPCFDDCVVVEFSKFLEIEGGRRRIISIFFDKFCIRLQKTKIKLGHYQKFKLIHYRKLKAIDRPAPAGYDGAIQGNPSGFNREDGRAVAVPPLCPGTKPARSHCPI